MVSLVIITAIVIGDMFLFVCGVPGVSSVLFPCLWLSVPVQSIARLRNDLLYVEWDVQPYTHPLTDLSAIWKFAVRRLYMISTAAAVYGHCSIIRPKYNYSNYSITKWPNCTGEQRPVLFVGFVIILNRLLILVHGQTVFPVVASCCLVRHGTDFPANLDTGKPSFFSSFKRDFIIHFISIDVRLNDYPAYSTLLTSYI